MGALLPPQGSAGDDQHVQMNQDPDFWSKASLPSTLVPHVSRLPSLGSQGHQQALLRELQRENISIFYASDVSTEPLTALCEPRFCAVPKLLKWAATLQAAYNWLIGLCQIVPLRTGPSELQACFVYEASWHLSYVPLWGHIACTEIAPSDLLLYEPLCSC